MELKHLIPLCQFYAKMLPCWLILPLEIIFSEECRLGMCFRDFKRAFAMLQVFRFFVLVATYMLSLGTCVFACERFDEPCLARSSLVSRGLNKSTKWQGKTEDVFNGAQRKTSVSATFKPKSETAGTWESSPLNIFAPTDQLQDPEQTAEGEQTKRGKWAGKYLLIGNQIMISEIVAPNGNTLGFGRSALVSVSGTELRIHEVSALPNAVTLLKPKN